MKQSGSTMLVSQKCNIKPDKRLIAFLPGKLEIQAPANSLPTMPFDSYACVEIWI